MAPPDLGNAALHHEHAIRDTEGTSSGRRIKKSAGEDEWRQRGKAHGEAGELTTRASAGKNNAPQALGGAVAQLGERLTGSQEVDGSIPFSSTTLSEAL